jgi:hypothetical protein
VTAPVADVSPVVDADASTAGGVSGPISAPVVAALESAWAAIRVRHPEVPAVVMVLGAGSIGNAGGPRARPPAVAPRLPVSRSHSPPRGRRRSARPGPAELGPTRSSPWTS